MMLRGKNRPPSKLRPTALFKSGEQGVHFEAYDPDTVAKRRNQLTFSEVFNNAAWGAGGAVIVPPPTVTDPFGLSNASKFREDATAGSSHGLTRAPAYRIGSLNTLSIFVKAAELSNVFLGANNATGFQYAVFNLANGTSSLATNNMGVSMPFGMVDAGGGWYRIWVSVTPNATATWSWDLRLSRDGNWNNRAYNGDNTSGVYIIGAQLDYGDLAPYQKVTDWTTEYLGGEAIVRRNLFTESEFRNGVTDAPTRGGLLSATTLPGYAGALAFGYDGGTTATFAYKLSVVAAPSTSYAISVIVKMDDGLPPSFGSSTVNHISNDFYFIVSGTSSGATNPTTYTVQDLGGGLYRVTSGRLTGASDPLPQNNGVLKNTGNSPRTFKVTAYQIELGTAATTYQPVTDWTSEVAADEATRLLRRSAIGMWQDSTGTTPVTAVEQPVGLWLDSKSALIRGPEAWNDSIVTFTAPSSKVSPGVYRVYSPTGAETADVFGANVVVGRWYEMTFNIDSVASAGSGLRVIGSAGLAPVIPATVGPKRAIGQADGALALIKRNAGVVDLQISNVSVREIPGNHATQATAASRPVLSARYNQLLNTASGLSLGTTSWGGSNSSGTLQADGSSLMARTSTVAGCYGQQTGLSAAVGTAIVGRIKVKKATVGNLYGLRLQGTYPDRADAVINLDTGAIAYFSPNTYYTGVTASSEGPDANGFYTLILRCTVVGTAFTQFIHGPTNVASSGWEGPSGALENAYAKEPDVRNADDASKNMPAYQRVNTATDYDTEGFPHYLKFDGVDDGLVTGPIDLTGTNKLTAMAAVTKFSDAAAGCMWEFGATTDLTPGVIGMVAAGAALIGVGEPNDRGNYSSRLNGNLALSSAYTVDSRVAAPASSLVTQLADLSASGAAKLVVRVNGAIPTEYRTTSLDPGAGNFTNQKLNIGKRDVSGSPTLPTNMRLYGLTLRGASSTTRFVKEVEKYIASLMGVKL